MRKLSLFAGGFILACCFANAQTIVMKVDGMKGESEKTKYKDRTELLGLVMEGSSSQSTGGGGLASGKRSYQPVTILKQTGASSPLLFQNFFTGRFIREVVIEYYTPNKTAAGTTDVLDYSITLRNVIITGFKQFSGPLKNERFDPVNDAFLYDEIKFNFQEIMLEYKKGAVIAQDNIISR